MMGKTKIAETLARAGLHLATTTVGRMLKNCPKPPTTPDRTSEPAHTGRVVTAKRPNHAWHLDLTAVPIARGFWTTWLPSSLPQRRPFCWWVAVAQDHFSRRIMGITGFKGQPNAILSELKYFAQWYNESRPHTTLDGRTPNEAYRQEPRRANRLPRFEPREEWPRGSPCAKPQTPVKPQPGVKLELHVAYHRGRKHLPIVTLRRAV